MPLSGPQSVARAVGRGDADWTGLSRNEASIGFISRLANPPAYRHPLYVLRKQLVHGGVTWNSAINRTQVGYRTRIMSFLLQIFIDLMMDHPEIA